MRRTVSLTVAALPLLLVTACDPPPTATADPGSAAARRAAPNAPVTPIVVVGGLRYPRGLTFGPDGSLYVAEAGTPQGHTISTEGLCAQVPAPIGPLRGGFTGRISRIDRRGVRTTVVRDLPSGLNADDAVIGVADVAFVDGRLFALLNAGCSHGHVGVPSSIIRVRRDGSWRVRADLSAWLVANPTAQPEPGDFEPDGDWYSMVAGRGVLYAVEANQGNLVSVTTSPWRVERIADVSATEGHVVPTAVALDGNRLLVGELTTFPVGPGAAEILRYRRGGQPLSPLTGFTAVLGVDVDRRGNVYVLESFTCPTAAPCFPSPGSGRVVRVGANGGRTVIVTGLSFATALRLAPDGRALYVSNFGYGPPDAGQILRIPLPR